jgi:hypothetical protein
MHITERIWMIRIIGMSFIILGAVIAGSIYYSAQRTQYSIGLIERERESIIITITNQTGTYTIEPTLNPNYTIPNSNVTIQASKFIIPLSQENQITLLEQLLIVSGIFAPFSIAFLDKIKPNDNNRMFAFGLLSIAFAVSDVLFIVFFLGLAIFGQQSIDDRVFPLAVFLLILGPSFSLLSYAERFSQNKQNEV